MQKPNSSAPDAGGATSTRMARNSRQRVIQRARFRAAFFLTLLALAALLGYTAAAAVAGLGLAVGLLTVAIAQRRGSHLAHSFVVLDWLLFGCVLALAGQSESWLLVAVPVLTAGHLGLSGHAEWPYLLAPCPLLVAVLAIADPSFGGHKLLSMALLVALVGGGVMAAQRLGLSRQRRRQHARFDTVSRLYSASYLREIGAVRLNVAAARGQELSLVYLRLDGVAALSRLHIRGRDAIVKRTADQIKQRLENGDSAFRLSVDEFVVLLPGRSPDESGRIMRSVAQEVVNTIAAGRRLELSVGSAGYPAHVSLDDLLSVAQASAQATATITGQLGETARLAAAQ